MSFCRKAWKLGPNASTSSNGDGNHQLKPTPVYYAMLCYAMLCNTKISYYMT